ncbi:FUSC family protein [Mycobacterium lacus]|uniref:Membrane protein n=1 Tax=Mycobacterium lacus TaxID=169765 RepID=A0A7I7NNW5_9MYCO|nr:FUSC family protein [Mycobacterium lacus]MCV7122741.1 FUSC family protein [Mycobacterium lacus]BBX98282.1 membrane protein [Mycobacterium lacus]
MATRTTAALAGSLLALYAMSKATGQPLTVALLGAVITMIAARSVDEPDPRRLRITMALLPVPAAVSITAAVLLAPDRVASDVAFVVVVFAAVYIRRFGSRGRALGMVAFMAYFFALYLRANTSELPWMIVAVLVGTLCTLVTSAYLLPDRPERVLRATIRSLRARMAIVVDTTADTLRAGGLDERRRRRLQARITRLNGTALMVQSQIEDGANPATLWPGVTGEQLARWLFDAELAVEWVAIAGQRAAAVAAEIPAATRIELAGALTQLARAIRVPRPGGLRRAANLARQFVDERAGPATADSASEAAAHRLALAIIAATTATSEIRALVEHAAANAAPDIVSTTPPPAPDNGGDQQPSGGLLPTTRQAIQVSVAASLAIVTGELVSPARWYWAVIAAFVVFAGTNSWGETLTKGWQRLLGTALGAPSGLLVATLVSGDTVESLVLIFVCLFCAFYFMKVTYSLMTFWITTMLALLLGLLGQFSLDVLLMRIEETAIGAVIGVSVAILVLPTNTRTVIRKDTRAFLTSLSALIETSMATMFDDEEAASPTEQARQLDRDLQQFRITAKPLLAGVAGFAGRRSIQRSLRLFTACDHYARNLARSSEQYQDPSCPPQLADAVTTAAEQTRRGIDALVAALDGAREVTVVPAADSLDAAEALARQHYGSSDPAAPGPNARRLLAALNSLRRIERAVVAAATHLGADAGLRLASPTGAARASTR